jgi:hypothetical protein
MKAKASRLPWKSLTWNRRPFALLVISLPLLLAVVTIALGLAGLVLRRLMPADTTFPISRGPLSPEQARAVAEAEQYCARLTGMTCVIDGAQITALTSLVPGRKRPRRDWDVDGRAGASRCNMHLDADTMALRLFSRESAFVSGETAQAAPTASADSGDISTLSAPQEERYARGYVARAGIVLSRGARPVRSVGGVYRFDADDACGVSRRIQVHIDRSDGRLLLLASHPVSGRP